MRRRGVALLVTVLLTGVAASMAIVVTQATVLSSRNKADQLDQAAAERLAWDALTQVEASLTADPAGFYMQVLPNERTRVCMYSAPVWYILGTAAGTPMPQGSIWRPYCGKHWVYTNTPAVTGPIKLELTPPSVLDPNLTVRVVARSGSSEVGLDASYRLDGSGKWAFATSGSADLDPQDAAVPSPGVWVRGSMYAASGLGTHVDRAAGAGQTVLTGSALPGDVDWTSPDSYVFVTDNDPLFGDLNAVTSGAVSQSPGSVSGVVNYAAANPVLAGAFPVGSASSAVDGTLSSGAMAGAAVVMADVGCPLTTNREPFDVVLRVLGGRTYSSHLCVGPNAVLLNQAGGTVTVPSDATHAMVVPIVTAAGEQAFEIWTSSATPTGGPTGSSPESELCASGPTCSLPTNFTTLADAANPALRAAAGFWTQLGGPSAAEQAFLMPVTGVIGSTLPTYVGFCGATDATSYGAGLTCPPINNNGDAAVADIGTRAPGLTITETFTITAGSTVAPQPLIISAPITAAGSANPAFVATGTVWLPYWIRPAGAQVRVDGQLFGGGGTGSPGVSSYPTAAYYTTYQEPSSVGDTLALEGVVGADTPLGVGGVQQVWFRPPAPSLNKDTPSWFGAAEMRWVRTSVNVLTPGDYCTDPAAAQCPDASWIV
jgi:hypothetical protein